MADALSVERAVFEKKFNTTTVDKEEAAKIHNTLCDLGGAPTIADIKVFARGWPQLQNTGYWILAVRWPGYWRDTGYSPRSGEVMAGYRILGPQIC